VLTQDNFVKSQLVAYGWRYGQLYGGGHLAGTLVMQALANRVRRGFGSYLQVLESVPNYMAEHEMPPLKYPSLWEPNFVKLLHAVEGIYSGSATDMTLGATMIDNKPRTGGLYFGLLNKIERPWFKTQIIDAINPLNGLRLHNRVADLNCLSFWD
jgi:hypothetical protein